MRESLSLAEARRHVLGHAKALGAETVAAREALGRVLAESIDSGRTLPPEDVSAMDGYAVRWEDCAGASVERPAGARQRPCRLSQAPCSRLTLNYPHNVKRLQVGQHHAQWLAGGKVLAGELGGGMGKLFAFEAGEALQPRFARRVEQV